jgi:cytoskeletal protein CcmA (bactofilin family)
MLTAKQTFPTFLGLGRKKRRFTDHMLPVTDHIGAGTLFSGDLSTSGNLVVSGEVRGDGDIEGGLTVAAGGRWNGNLRAHRIVVAGVVDGDVTAFEHLELAETAHVTGNLISPVIAIAAGARYDGKVRTPRKSQVTQFTERRGRRPAPDPQAP